MYVKELALEKHSASFETECFFGSERVAEQDDRRETDDQAVRSKLYKDAMGYILDLAVELPVYQRDVLYAYNANVLKAESMPTQEELNPYSSPLDRIWEIEFAAN